MCQDKGYSQCQRRVVVAGIEGVVVMVKVVKVVGVMMEMEVW